MLPGCEKPSRNKKEPGPCRMHQSRIQRHGSPDIILRSSPEQPFCPLRQVKKSEGTLYWVTIVNGKPAYVHRLAVEHYLGRPLASDEIVHHKDSNGLNNHPSNFELTDRSRHIIYHNSFVEEPF